MRHPSRIGSIVLIILFYCFTTKAEEPSTPFKHSTTDLAIDAVSLGIGMLFKVVQVNENHPLLSSDVKNYRDESVPWWALPVIQIGYSSTFFIVNPNDALRQFRGASMAFCVNVGMHSIVSSCSGRKRPNYDDAMARGYKGEKRAFYSGHTALSFCSATYMSLYAHSQLNNRIFKIVVPIFCYGMAGYVGYTRYHEHFHHFSDVATGAAVGTASTWWCYHLFQQKQQKIQVDANSQGIRVLWHF